jgi:hypothetical protein
VLPDAIPAKAGSLNRAVIYHWPEKEGMAWFLPSWYKLYGVLARSLYKLDRSHELIPGYKFSGRHWRSVAVQTISKTEIYHGAGF